MRELFTKSFVRALIITLVSASIIAGAVYAYETLWSGKAAITIEPPTSSEAELQITSIEASPNSNWSETTDTWTVSIGQAEMAELIFTFKNNGGDACRIVTYIDGEKRDYKQIGAGVFFHGIDYPLAAGGEVTRVFIIEATLDAEPGTLSDIALEIRQE
jgi:hypothetical protein